MLEQKTMMDTLWSGVVPVLEKCGFAPEWQEGASRKDSAVYARGESSVMDFVGTDSRLRFVYNDNRIHFLIAPIDAETADDSAFKRDTTYLMVLNEYDEKDVKSLINEITDYLSETYLRKDSRASKKAPATVSRAAAKSGALSYDSITLATKIAGIFPELKPIINGNIATYGEFLCEDFFVNYGTPRVMEIIKQNDVQKMKRLFNILGEVYEDGTNEVQSLICVTVLGPIENDPELVQRIMPYLTDTMLEPVLSVSECLKKSRTARLRLENPPAYKPKKQKSPGFLSQLMGGGAGLQQ